MCYLRMIFFLIIADDHWSHQKQDVMRQGASENTKYNVLHLNPFLSVEKQNSSSTANTLTNWEKRKLEQKWSCYSFYFLQFL